MAKRPRGRVSLYRGKIRKPVSLTLTPDHHRKVKENMTRLTITSRADFIALLIDRYASVVGEPSADASADHAAVESRPAIGVPTAVKYADALRSLPLTPKQRKMLAFHYQAHNRSISYSDLDEHLAYKPGASKLHYGKLAEKIG